jgi:acetyl/propionyl-CoA carboxylase alpha subunit/acetyl-CoA carboxylase carboxyltransferase component
MNGPLLQPDARIAIVNRADAAVRAVHGIRDHNRARGTALRSVILYTDADAGAWFVELADEAHPLGPARISDPGTGLQTHALLDLGVLERALTAVGADAVWVGWGFVSERAEFADLCARLGIVFLGPDADVIRRLGDKIAAKRLAESVAVPVAAWSGGPVADPAAARRVGFPLLVKAAAGGGGRGIRYVETEAGLDAALTSVRAEAASAFGDATLFLERSVGRARHLEVQVAGDLHGTVRVLGVRDCSVQRRRQKVIEESGAPGLEHLVPALTGHAVSIAAAAGYTGLGTIEFLYDLDRGELAFMEVNPRLQVEHGVTELTTGLDLVGLQLDIAAGLPLPDVPAPAGHAIEARLTAEDMLDGFRPAPGRLATVRLPSGPGLRVDSGVREGDEIPPDFDPLVLKILAFGATRSEALARLVRAVDDTVVVVAGGATTKGFLRQLLRRPELPGGGVDTGWADRLVESGAMSAEDGDVALVLAAVDLAGRARARARAHLMSSAARGRPDLVGAVGHEAQLSLGGVEYSLVIHRCGEFRYVLETADGVVDVEVRPGRDGWSVTLHRGSRRWDAAVLAATTHVQVDIAGHTYRIGQAGESGVLRAPLPGVVVQVRVEPGQPVAADEVLVVLESMKLEVPMRAVASGVVRRVAVSVGSQVDVSEPLLHFEPDAAEADVTIPRAKVGFDRLVPGGAGTAPGPAELLRVVRQVLDGFDAGPLPLADLDGRLAQAYGDTDTGVASLEVAVLAAFADRVETTAAVAAAPALSRGLSSRELLYAFLRAPGRSQQTLPAEYVARLERALAGFGATGLDADEHLDEACYRLCCAQRALPAVGAVVRRILHRHLDAGADTVPLPLLARLSALCDGPFPAVSEAARAVAHTLTAAGDGSSPPLSGPLLLEHVLRRHYDDDLGGLSPVGDAVGAIGPDGEVVLATVGAPGADVLADVAPAALEVVLPPSPAPPTAADARAAVLGRAVPPPGLRRVTVTGLRPDGGAYERVATVERAGDGWPESAVPGIHPAVARRLELWRWRGFSADLLDADRGAYLLRVVARGTAADTRLVLLLDVRRLPPDGLAGLEAFILRSLDMMRAHVSGVAQLTYNRLVLYVRPLWTYDDAAIADVIRRIVPVSRNLGLEQVLIRVTSPGPVDRLIHVSRLSSTGMSLGESVPSDAPVRPLSARQLRTMRLRRRGIYDPWEIVDLLTSPRATLSDFPPGTFAELELDGDELVRIDRPRGENPAGVVVGLVENRTAEHPEGIRRVVVLGDAHRGLGALAEPECRRILAALRLAHTRKLPLEWFALSSGARISMTSGTENMDWVARVLRAIVELTQAGLEINIVVAGVNVGAQPYFNAEATMLMHTRGILVMVPTSSMLLTGKEALDFAGGVSAEDNLGIGGYDRVMGPNGQAQYWAPHLEGACAVLFRHYDHTYVAPGESGPRRRRTGDPPERDISTAPHAAMDGSEFGTVGDIFSAALNPDRKKPYDMRSVLRAVVDTDCTPLERWPGMAGAESAIVWDAHVGGHPVCLLGIESHSLPRSGIIPADGPDSWTGATLFPRSSKKIARALNGASGNRPVVVLANLAGFDGSPESLRELQLEYGAEIGRAVTNFDGRLVFCVVSRYHGGAFVVFSKSLNDRLEVIAVEGAKASVIGGSAAAAVIFGREVAARVEKDPRLAADGPGRTELVARVTAEVRSAVAREFDDTHTIRRALAVGSVDRIVAPAELRAAIIGSVGSG